MHLCRRDSDIWPVASNYSLLLAVMVLILATDILRETQWFRGPVFEEINDKAAKFSVKVFWQGP